MAETALTGKTALITGAGSGIGREVALELARRGVSVALAGRTKTKLTETAAQIGYEGGDAVTIPADVTDPVQVERLVAETTRAFDGLDILLNSAGVGLIKPLETTTPAEIDRLLDTNVKGLMLVTQAALRPMIAGGQRRPCRQYRRHSRQSADGERQPLLRVQVRRHGLFQSPAA